MVEQGVVGHGRPVWRGPSGVNYGGRNLTISQIGW